MLERLNNILRARKESDKGFSLVELAVVIVIIGILVAIAVPVFTSMAGTAQDNAHKANAANGAAMVAAEIAASGGESIPYADAREVLDKLKDDGTIVASTLTPASGDVSLDDFCVTVGGFSSGPCP